MNTINWDMVTEAGLSIRRLPSGQWFAGLDHRSAAGVWADSPQAAGEALPDALRSRIAFLEDRIARGEYYPHEPAEVDWLRAVVA